MGNRSAQRYDGRILLDDLTKVMLVFPDKYEIEASIEDISSQGVRVSIPPSDAYLSIPWNDETIEISFAAIELRVTCKCIYSMNCEDGSLLVGFYVFDPDEQTKLRIILDKVD
jgi:hypothetical protein